MLKLISIFVVLTLVAACACSSEGSIPAISTSVHADADAGFRYSTPDGVTVTGAPGAVVAPAAEVAITTTSRPQEQLPSGLAYLGVSVEIVIGTGAQPGAPITVSVPMPAELNGDVTSVVGYTIHDGVPEFLPITEVDGMMTATMTHLSWLDFFKVDFSNLADQIGMLAAEMLTGQSNAPPECLEQIVSVGGVTYKAVRTKTESGTDMNAVYPCLRVADGDSIALTLTANGNRAWLVRTDPDVGNGAMSATGSGPSTAAGFYQTFAAVGSHSTGTLMPGTELTYSFSPNNPPQRAEVLVDAGLMLTSALVYEIMAIFDFTGMSTYTKLDQAPGVWDCISSAADTVSSRTQDFVGNFASAFSTVLDCMAAVVPGPVAFLLGVLNTGAGLVAGLLTSAWAEITRDNHGIIAIERTSTTTMASDFTQEWTGHTRQMTIHDDGTASIEIFSGAADGEQWRAQWTTTPDGITITLISRTSITGAGLGDLHEGTTWNGQLQQAYDGPTVLHFAEPGHDLSSPDSGFFWCSNDYGYSQLCGA